MKVVVRKRFISNASKLRSDELIDELIFLLKTASKAEAPSTISGFKWMTGYSNLGRIKFGEYRIGVQVEKSTSIFVCLLHRSVIYSQFP